MITKIYTKEELDKLYPSCLDTVYGQIDFRDTHGFGATLRNSDSCLAIFTTKYPDREPCIHKDLMKELLPYLTNFAETGKLY
jgi:hypothetical protein